ncbi:MAG: ATP-grasp domain-containing protein [Clostridiales Family XIII bacterium]|jgi:acetyl/propionyl-CoA carboxylase alpha subunit|nr:ATP-grasp domain-containing protein [Clostridiales Family XIII bacterium]
MIKKILIANRGEIVNRIIRTCEKFGIEAVAVYSDADKDMEYIKNAAESYNIGSAAPIKSYLNIGAITEAIAKSGAEAVHPGYGFLSESAEFAAVVEGMGVKWIGPGSQVMKSIESKSYCRIAADAVGVPVTPGTVGIVSNVDDIYRIAHKVGLPVLLKLDKGGGGKGIEKIESLESREAVQDVFDRLKRIGAMAFASSDVYLEKQIASPKHIEVQFVADARGDVICLGERECSIQRRYQKIVEESPSAAVNEEDRLKLYDYTKRIVKAIAYTGVGTIEFLKGESGYFFMEINARLQVEHPVSEMVTGLDLVEWQIRIADGENLSFTQEDVRLGGHAIECRVYAEEPVTFTPSPGVITKLVFPEENDGALRIEHALHTGYVVTPFYDPMLCKLIALHNNREACIGVMKAALEDMKIEGVSTNIDVGLAVMEDKRFISGGFSTDFFAG